MVLNLDSVNFNTAPSLIDEKWDPDTFESGPSNSLFRGGFSRERITWSLWFFECTHITIKKKQNKRKRGGEKEKGRKKKWTSAHLHSSVLICGSGATDGISNWTRETTPGVDRWHRYNGTLEETSAPCTLNPLSFVSIILPTTLAACTLVLPVIIRTSVSKGGEGEVSGGEFERRTNDKWEHVQRSRIWYREWRVSLHFSLPCCLQFISPSRP